MANALLRTLPRTYENKDHPGSGQKKEPNLGQKEARQQEKSTSDLHHIEKVRRMTSIHARRNSDGADNCFLALCGVKVFRSD